MNIIVTAWRGTVSRETSWDDTVTMDTTWGGIVNTDTGWEATVSMETGWDVTTPSPVTTPSGGGVPTPVPVLASRLIEYKISIYILTYLTIPVAVWGWVGNAISFR